jgi:hypothetical protein
MNRRMMRCAMAVMLSLIAAGRGLALAAPDGLRGAAVLSFANHAEGCRAYSVTGAATVAKQEGLLVDRLSAGSFQTVQRRMNVCSEADGSRSGASPVNAAPRDQHVIFIWPML